MILINNRVQTPGIWLKPSSKITTKCRIADVIITARPFGRDSNTSNWIIAVPSGRSCSQISNPLSDGSEIAVLADNGTIKQGVSFAVNDVF